VKAYPYLSFDGQCEAALRFYERCLGGKVVCLLTYAESPMAAEVPPEWGGKILHATLELDGQVIGAADAFPGSYRSPQGFSVTLQIDAPTEAERVFAMLADGGTVQLPLQGTFWALRFGMLTDRFGTPWMINCGDPASP
jgi:PhnB protein